MRKQVVDLCGTWQLAGFDGYGQMLGDTSLPAGLENFSWIEAAVPGSVYLDLMRAEWIADVHAGCNTLAAQWVERQYWFYRRRFHVTPEVAGARSYLVLYQVDLDAVIYLNGQMLAEHHNVFRPCRIDVTGRLRAGDNELLVRVDSGLLGAADRRGGDYNLELTAATSKRSHLRKPQYACRWDWSPRLMNVGLGGAVSLEICPRARLDQVVIVPQVSGEGRARFVVRAGVENTADRSVDLVLRCTMEGEVAAVETAAAVAPGVGELRAEIELAEPRWWWPRGWGAQEMYTVDVTLLEGCTVLDAVRRRTGLRTVEIAQDPAPDGGRFFHLRVNGEPIFCKGANWVPADLLYPSVTRRDHAELVALAAECEFNLLRIWGGGLYAGHDLLEACDAAGILVWHDMIFACGKFPGDQPAFRAEVAAEVQYQVRELAHHPSLAVWCGNNEVELGIRDGWITGYDPSTRPCHDLFYNLFAEVVQREDGSRPYWPTSPWSPDGSHPNDPRIGDQHPWFVGLGEAKADYWQYRADASRFPNEGGMLGPSTMRTLRQILPERERFVGSRTWLHHDNTQNTWRGEPMVDHLLRLNLCAHPRRLRFEDYVRYAGLLHGEALETAIDNWRRRKFASGAAVFWMFNDTWPTCTSWTPIDYYRRRKPAFWYVRRAFAPLRPVCVELDGEVVVFVVNDALGPQDVELRYGLFALAGGRPFEETRGLTCPANSAVAAARFPLAKWDRLGVAGYGAFAVLSSPDGESATQRLFRARFRDLAWAEAHVQVTPSERGLKLVSDQFAWAVCVDPSGELALPDNCFDLIPGIEREIAWPAELPRPALFQPANPPAHVLCP